MNNSRKKSSTCQNPENSVFGNQRGVPGAVANTLFSGFWPVEDFLRELFVSSTSKNGPTTGSTGSMGAGRVREKYRLADSDRF